MLVGMHGVGLHEWWPVAGPLLAVWILFKLAFWALLIAGVVLGIRWPGRGGCERWRQTPLDALRLRYARGDINREERTSRDASLSGTSVVAGWCGTSPSVPRGPPCTRHPPLPGARASKPVSENIRCTEEPLGRPKVVPDFRPRPEDLVFRDEGGKVTIDPRPLIRAASEPAIAGVAGGRRFGARIGCSSGDVAIRDVRSARWPPGDAGPADLLQLPESPHARALQSLACLEKPWTALRGTLIVRPDKARHRRVNPLERGIGRGVHRFSSLTSVRLIPGSSGTAGRRPSGAGGAPAPWFRIARSRTAAPMMSRQPPNPQGVPHLPSTRARDQVVASGSWGGSLWSALPLGGHCRSPGRSRPLDLGPTGRRSVRAPFRSRRPGPARRTAGQRDGRGRAGALIARNYGVPSFSRRAMPCSASSVGGTGASVGTVPAPGRRAQTLVNSAPKKRICAE
jgi:hypothetical protein